VKEGHQVTLVDPVLPGQSTSFGNAGCISPNAVIPFSYPGVIRQVPGWLLDSKGPLFIRWAHLPAVLPWLWRFWRAGSMEQVEAIAEAQDRLMSTVRSDYDRILSETGSEWLREKNGLIMLYDSEARFEADAWQFELRKRLGQQWKRLSHDELRDLEPALAEGDAAARRVAVYDPVWAHLVDPAEVTRNIAEAAFAGGAHWLRDKVVSVSESGSGLQLRTAGGQSLDADHVVIAAGVWSGKLLAPLGVRVPLAAKRGYHTMVHQPSVEISHPIMSVSRLFMLTPMRLGLRLAGTAEFAAIDASPDYRRAKVLLEHARHYLPGLEGESYSEWMGQRPMMPDSKPVIGPIPGHDNIWCAFGHGHYGLTQGPTTARIIADLVAGREPHLDLAPFASDRF
jgi:D-amino-acid dehydrogenase